MSDLLLELLDLVREPVEDHDLLFRGLGGGIEQRVGPARVARIATQGQAMSRRAEQAALLQLSKLEDESVRSDDLDRSRVAAERDATVLADGPVLAAAPEGRGEPGAGQIGLCRFSYSSC